jgi:hypothetical protein
MSDSDCIVMRRNQLIAQINDVLCVLGKLNIATKSNLLQSFCSSYYGSVLWDLWAP